MSTIQLPWPIGMPETRGDVFGVKPPLRGGAVARIADEGAQQSHDANRRGWRGGCG